WRKAYHGLGSSRLRNIINPRFEKRMVGKNQVRQAAGLVEKAAEAGDERNFCKRLFHLPSQWRSENRIRFMHKQHFDRPRLARKNLLGQCTDRTCLAYSRVIPRRRASGQWRLWRELQSARFPDALQQCIQGVDREGRE